MIWLGWATTVRLPNVVTARQFSPLIFVGVVGLLEFQMLMGGVVEVQRLWFPMVVEFGQSMIAVSRVVVNRDARGGTLTPSFLL